MSLALSLIFFVSGAAALVFETLWFRQAGLAFGNGVWASSIVLASFMIGLALGNAWTAWAGERVTRPIRFYAWIEVAIAVSGVALVWLLPALGGLLTPVLDAFADLPLLLNFVRLGSGFLLLLVPATAMGATLPILVKALLARDPNFGAALGRLYGWNTLGAVVGALAGEGALLARFGVYGAAFVAGGLNVCASLAALALARRLEPAEAVAAPKTTSARLSPAASRCCAAAFLAGGILLALEVVWFRFLSLFVWTQPLSFALMLAVVLAGIGLGGFGAGRVLRRFPDVDAFARAVAFLAGVVWVASYASFGSAIEPYRLSYVRAPLAILWLSLALMFPLSLLSGALFTGIGTALDRHVSPETRSAGLLVLSNTVGAGLGSLLAGFVLLPVLGMERSFLLLAGLYGVVAMLAPAPLAEPELRAPRIAGRIAAAAFGVAILVFPLGAMESRFLALPLERYSLGTDSELVARREGRSETIQYVRETYLGETLYLRMLTDGYSMSATSEAARRYMKLYVWWPVALTAPRSALLISYGVGSTAKALTRTTSLEQIDVVDISREVLELSPVVFPEPSEDPLRDPRVRVHVEDGRYFLRSSARRYDLITGEPPPPKMAGIVNLYTREYFELVREHLSEGGVHTYWLPVHSLTVADAKAIVAAYCDVFPDCSLWNGNDLDWMLVGTRDARWHRSAERLARLWRDPWVRPELVATGLERPEQLGALFLADPERLRGWVGATPPLTDAWPKRLSSDRPSAGREELRAFMDAQTAREVFRTSDFVRALWPPELMGEALGAFELQRIVNQVSARPPLPRSLVERSADLHFVLSETSLVTLPLWQQGTSTDRQRIVRRRARSGVPDTAQPRQMAMAALSERRYGDAADLLEVVRQRLPDDPGVFYDTVYALAAAGRRDRAEALVAGLGPRFLRGDDSKAWWRWMRGTFGLGPAKGSGRVASEAHGTAG